MSNLVLTRTAGKSVRLEMSPGVFQKLTVVYVGGDQVKLELTADDGSSSSKRINVDAEWQIRDDITIKLIGIQFRQAKLGFNAPQSVKIARTELLERATQPTT